MIPSFDAVDCNSDPVGLAQFYITGVNVSSFATTTGWCNSHPHLTKEFQKVHSFPVICIFLELFKELSEARISILLRENKHLFILLPTNFLNIYVFMILKGRVAETEIPSVGSLSKWSQPKQGAWSFIQVSRTDAGAHALAPSSSKSPTRIRGSNTCAIF